MATDCICADFLYKIAVARLHCHTAVSSIVVTSLDHNIIQDERDRQLHWLTQQGKHTEKCQIGSLSKNSVIITHIHSVLKIVPLTVV